MATIRHDIRINRPADEVWALITDSSRWPEWFENLDSVEATESERTVNFSFGVSLAETIVSNDHTLRRFQYAIKEGMPVEKHLGTVDVLEDGPDACRVIYSTDVDDSLAPIIDPGTEAGLRGLKAVAEGTAA